MTEKFSIDELFRLREEDPDAFEKKCQELIENTINSAPLELRRKLVGIQWKISMERQKFKGSQLDFASYVFGMAWSSFLELNSSLKSLA